MSIEEAKQELNLENLSYINNMISRIDVGTKVLLKDTDSPGFNAEAAGAAKFMKEDGLVQGSYDAFFQKIRKAMSDIDVYRTELKTEEEERIEQAEIKLGKVATEYTNKINFKLWPWVIVSFILGLSVVFLTMFVVWYFSNGDSQNSNTSNLYDDVFCGGCKKESSNDD